MSTSYGHDFTENLDAVARGVRLLGEVRDPQLRDALRAALGMPPEQPALDGPRRARMRRNVLAAEPRGPRFSDHVVAAFTILAYPAPYAVRALVIAALVVGALAGMAVVSADAMPEDALYSVKVGAEQLRLELAVAPADRAAVELSLADHRLDEAEQLAADGHESGALVATSAYAAHLASAAAELSEVDELAPRATALVRQLEARLFEQRTRAAEAAERLMNDPRTVLAGVVLSAVATAPEGNGATVAARIADSASAVSSRLSVVADDRASATAKPSARPAPRATATPRSTVDPSARIAAEKAKQSAAKAKAALEKANRAAQRTTSARQAKR